MIEILLIFGGLAGLIVYLCITTHKHRRAIDVLIDAHNKTHDECRFLRCSLKSLIDAGPITCETCGGNLFVCPDNEWVCKSCRQPAPSDFAKQLDDPDESRTIN